MLYMTSCMVFYNGVYTGIIYCILIFCNSFLQKVLPCVKTQMDKVTGSLYKQNQAHEMLGCLLKSLTTVQLVIIFSAS